MKALIPVFGGLILSYGWTHMHNEYFYNPNDNIFIITEKVLKNVQSGIVAVIVQNMILNESYFIHNKISLNEELTRIMCWFFCLDLSFYLSHRAMHKYKWLYTRIHKEHHLAVNTYPIDAYILTPVETVFITLNILTGNILGIKTTERSHLVLMFFLLFHNILIHGSPSYTKYISFHNVHHRLQNYNFAGNTPFWDILFGTYK